jgi:hypothetical protein
MQNLDSAMNTDSDTTNAVEVLANDNKIPDEDSLISDEELEEVELHFPEKHQNNLAKKFAIKFVEQLKKRWVIIGLILAGNQEKLHHNDLPI